MTVTESASLPQIITIKASGKGLGQKVIKGMNSINYHRIRERG